MDDIYKGVKKTDGETYDVESEEADRRPFRAVLDVGLANTTTGNRVFGALKGAIDGGMLVPYSEKRFPGYENGEERGSGSYNAEAHRERIFGCHVDKYMESLKGEAEAYKS